MMCEGGCINGAGTIVTQAKAKSAFVKINNGSPIKAVIKNEKLEEFKDINLERKVMVNNK